LGLLACCVQTLIGVCYAADGRQQKGLEGFGKAQGRTTRARVIYF